MARRWQWTYLAEPGWYIVLSRLGGARDPGERWETELSMPREGVRLYYHRTRRAALRDLRRLGIKPARQDRWKVLRRISRLTATSVKAGR